MSGGRSGARRGAFLRSANTGTALRRERQSASLSTAGRFAGSHCHVWLPQAIVCTVSSYSTCSYCAMFLWQPRQDFYPTCVSASCFLSPSHTDTHQCTPSLQKALANEIRRSSWLTLITFSPKFSSLKHPELSLHTTAAPPQIYLYLRSSTRNVHGSFEAPVRACVLRLVSGEFLHVASPIESSSA